MKKIITLFAFLTLFTTQLAEARIYIPIDQPSDQKFPIAVPNLQGDSEGEKIAAIIRNDMWLSGYFRVIFSPGTDKFAEKEGISAEQIRFDYWTSIEAQALVKGEVSHEHGNMIVTIRLFDTFNHEMLVGKQYKSDEKHLREIAHRFSDEIMEALTGIRGVFNTKITYAAQTGKGDKQIYIMDMDGYNPTAITKNKAINISPSWSPDGSQIVFTSYMKGSPDLYIVTVGKNDYKKITANSGINITPHWSPDGKTIAFSSSITGISNLYTMVIGSKKMKRVTNVPFIDVAPSWSSDGGSLVFSTERAGGLHIYRIPAGGGDAQRLTFVGYQNDMPDCSPIGDKIVFAGRDMGTFDIFIMNIDGTNIQRLTVGSGSNEHPSFSPDGRFITFSSTRSGGPAIYMMRADGSNQTKISEGNGVLPDWGP